MTKPKTKAVKDLPPEKRAKVKGGFRVKTEKGRTLNSRGPCFYAGVQSSGG